MKDLCGVVIVLDLDCGGDIMNLHMIKWHRTHIVPTPILYYTIIM